ncbi:T9SS type A sorting domain-containing protein [Acidiluteibacter ferrifornacis]|uniref:T9SS type A sorting domain-containing protein n=1 Tax=Acidiluteibacter ferrifornacis TaxID=2692424 RepID=A0A6N9NIP1_9FLAO|nr:T9SS type A sorting domain-containing protein [Acidiluteibacter ferrifornacis]NBG65783.1 T9SS type A sorting domain-containing protein [Acidiluteibacter ferrifornacis]
MKKILLSLVAMAAGTWAMAQTPVSIYDISYVSPSDLAACIDTNQYLGDTVITRGYVVTPGNLSEVASSSVTGGSRPFIYLLDTASANGAAGSFLGIEVMGAVGNTPAPAIEGAQSGDLIEITGIVNQYQGGLQLTPLTSSSVTLITPSAITPTPALISIGDLNDQSRVNKLTTGEQWEGSFVEFQNVTVIGVSFFGGGSRVSFDIADANGNEINVSDEFLAQRLPSHTVVNPNSPNSVANGGPGTGTFVAPVVGTVYSSIKGMIRHSENGCTGGTGRGYELNPFDSTHYVKGATPPSITNVVRNPIVPNATQTVTITADIIDNDGVVTSASLFYSADPAATRSTFTSVAMTATGNSYTATIPAFPLDTMVRYFIEATDDSSNVSSYPSANSVAFYTVRSTGFSIVDVQNPGPNSSTDSPYDGQSVTFTGAVTATLNQYNLGYVYIQDTIATEYAGVYVTGNAALAGLAIGDVATITGDVSEVYGVTTVTVTNVTKLNTTFNIAPISVTPDANFDAKAEMYEGMLISLDDPNNGKIDIIEADLNNGEFGIGLSGSNDFVRVLSGRVSGTTAQSSLNVSLVTDSFYIQNQGVMNVPAIITDTTQDMDAMVGILWYSFGTFKLTPRNNADIINFSLPLVIVGAKEEVNNTINMKYYPNPASSNVTIEVKNAEGVNYEAFFYDLKGQLLKSESLRNTTNNVNVSDFNNGIYIVRIMNNNEVVGTTKLVISK